MTTKEKVIRESISRLEKEMLHIDKILNANPISEICQVRINAQLLMENTKGKDRFSDQFLSAMKGLAEKEKALFELADKQKDSAGLIKRKVDVGSELLDLRNELFRINR